MKVFVSNQVQSEIAQNLVISFIGIEQESLETFNDVLDKASEIIQHLKGDLALNRTIADEVTVINSFNQDLLQDVQTESPESINHLSNGDEQAEPEINTDPVTII
jgi:flagellin-specific chaperone FliS